MQTHIGLSDVYQPVCVYGYLGAVSLKILGSKLTAKLV